MATTKKKKGRLLRAQPGVQEKNGTRRLPLPLLPPLQGLKMASQPWTKKQRLEARELPLKLQPVGVQSTR